MFYRVEQAFQWTTGPTTGPIATANGTSNPERIDHLRDLAIEVDGTFTGAVDVAMRASSTSSFVVVGTVTNGPGIVTPPNNAPFHDAQVTVRGFVSGTISAKFIGRTAQI